MHSQVTWRTEGNHVHHSLHLLPNAGVVPLSLLRGPDFPGPPQRIWGIRRGNENTTPGRALQHTEGKRVFTVARLESISCIRLWNLLRENDVVGRNPSLINVALKQIQFASIIFHVDLSACP